MQRLTALALLAALAGPAAALGADLCQARASGPPPRVVELYTSEGCDSCPPADRWLSTLKPPAGVLAAAFHVDYWDRLGWRDRFADPSHTQRQAAAQALSGARFSYTPQVLVDGRDWRGWPGLPAAATAAAPVSLALQRHGDEVRVQVGPTGTASTRLALWWALLEDGHESAVKAGENAGALLRHDHVVRRHGSLPPWPGTQATEFTLAVPHGGEGGRAARLLVVVTDPQGRTLQAAQLGC